MISYQNAYLLSISFTIQTIHSYRLALMARWGDWNILKYLIMRYSSQEIYHIFGLKFFWVYTYIFWGPQITKKVVFANFVSVSISTITKSGKSRGGNLIFSLLTKKKDPPIRIFCIWVSFFFTFFSHNSKHCWNLFRTLFQATGRWRTSSRLFAD